MIDAKIKVHCTDNGKDFDMYILNYKPRAWLNVAFETLKIRLTYQAVNRVFVGSLGGKEFTVKENDLPNYQGDYRR